MRIFFFNQSLMKKLTHENTDYIYLFILGKMLNSIAKKIRDSHDKGYKRINASIFSHLQNVSIFSHLQNAATT